MRALWGGGKHEAGIRPGTENVAGIVGFGEAAALAHAALATSAARLEALGARLIAGMREVAPGVREACPAAHRAPHIVTLILPHPKPEALLNALEARGVFVSAGAACAARDKSHGSRAMAGALGLEKNEGLLRFSLARTTTEADIDAALRAMPQALAEARP
jgi:cysteine desulfurase